MIADKPSCGSLKRNAEKRTAVEHLGHGSETVRVDDEMPKLNKLEQRKQLYDVIDLIFDGPIVGQKASWAKKVTSGISQIIAEAGRALDVIAGEALAPVAVPPEVIRAAYRSADDDPNYDPTLKLPVDDRWEEIGRKARNDSLSVEERRRVAIAFLREIAPYAHPILEEITAAVVALPFGEVKAILQPSRKGLHGIGHGHSAWCLRLRGLQCAEYLFHAGIISKTDAIKAVAAAFSRSVVAVRGGGKTKGWYEQAETHFGIRHVEWKLYVARTAGLLLKSKRSCAQEEANSPGANQPVESSELIDEFFRMFERVFGPKRLRDYGKQFQQLPRKKIR
jgi:hypothetical protein